MLRRAASLGSGGGWRGWDDAVGTCTESLGSETGDVGGDAEIDRQLGQQAQQAASADAAAAAGDEEEDDEGPPEETVTNSPRRRLPPPMPRAADGGGRFMRAERRDGRLVLTEVRAVEQRRREVFCAERAGGRLRLQFAAAAAAAGREEEAHEAYRPGIDGEEDGEASVVGGGGCCQSDAGAGGRRRVVEIGAVMGATT